MSAHGRPRAGSPSGLLRESINGPTTGPLSPVRPMVLAILREELGRCSSVAELCRVLGISRDALERLRSVPEVDAMIVDFLK